MEKIINTSKRSIILILTLCILLCTSGIGANAISVSEENIVTAEETTVVVEETKVAIAESTVADEETMSELMPMMAQRCCDDDYSDYDYSDYDGMTFSSTSQGLNTMGIPFSGSGSSILLLSPMLDINFSQCGTDLCVFITDKSTGRQLSWFKVKRW